MMTTESVTLVRIPDTTGDGNRKRVLRFTQDDSPQKDAQKKRRAIMPGALSTFASKAPAVRGKSYCCDCGGGCTGVCCSGGRGATVGTPRITGTCPCSASAIRLPRRL